MEVAAIKHGMGGVATGEHIENHVVGTIHICTVANSDVAHKSLHLIIFLQVAGYIYMQTGGNGHRTISKP